MMSNVGKELLGAVTPNRPKSAANRIFQAILAVAVCGGIVMLVAGLSVGDGGKNLAFAWLVNTWFVISICLGAIFFVGIQHITRSGWSVTLRRGAEIIGASVIGPALLLVPVLVTLLLGSDVLYTWNDPDFVTGDKILEGKRAYLNTPFFLLRTLIYGSVWIGSGIWFLRVSRRQDSSGDRQLTLLLERRSAPILIALGLTVTFAAFDWLMSLEPHWFSTIYGVYFFSGCLVSALAVLAIGAAVAVRTDFGPITKEHLHDIAKLLYGFNCFWAYIAFSQYLLIWYANIPEETIWIIHRQQHGWSLVTFALVIGHFLIPSLGLMSRSAKRSPLTVIGISMLLLAMHWLDLYWLAYPQLNEAPVFGLVEVAGLFVAVGVTATCVLQFAGSGKLIAVNDPRLAESVSHHVL